MAGGTGGHVFPGLAVADVLRSRSCRVVWLGTRRGLEARVVPAAGLEMTWLRVTGLRGKGLLSWLAAPVKLTRALLDARRAIRDIRPDVVLGLGGFVAGPGGLVARLMRLPLVIHEQNAVVGVTNRLLARIASTVAEAFPGTFSSTVGAVAVGNPVRRAIEDLANGSARHSVEINKHVFIFGGSQGAAALNRVVPEALARLSPANRPAVIHQTGRHHAQAVADRYAALGIKAQVVEFVEDMAAAYQWADLAVTRSGAMTVAELATAGVPAVLVPFPAAVDDHQTVNARFLSMRGAAILLPEQLLTADTLGRELERLLSNDPPVLSVMSAAARGVSAPGAAERLADLVLQAAGARI
jgi:UDP-N-acetylglucosamine--N-acetylmuramyl-(pentapeptide) pyrophosphoryl-undecaprenol N-acetylglucosamine transferase